MRKRRDVEGVAAVIFMMLSFLPAF